MGFTQSTVMRCLFHKMCPDGSQIILLDCTDDGTNDSTLKQFEEELSSRFELELMEQAHSITQLANFDIMIKQCIAYPSWTDTLKPQDAQQHKMSPSTLYLLTLISPQVKTKILPSVTAWFSNLDRAILQGLGLIHGIGRRIFMCHQKTKE